MACGGYKKNCMDLGTFGLGYRKNMEDVWHQYIPLDLFACAPLSVSRTAELAVQWGTCARTTLNLGYCPHPVTVYIRGPIKGYI